MNRFLTFIFGIVFCVVLARGLAAEDTVFTAAAAVNDAQFHARLLEIAKDYKTWGRVDDEFRWAPFLCRMPQPSTARFSASDQSDTHGQKLYYLFAKDRPAYLAWTRPDPPAGAQQLTPDGKVQPVPPPQRPKANAVGQILVKEAWLPKPVSAQDEAKLLDRKTEVKGEIVVNLMGGETVRAKQEPSSKEGPGGAYSPYARREGKLYSADSLAGLYILLKLDPATPGTDDGWVYGTVTADGKTVTSAGKVQSCMECHKDAKHDHLFGVEYHGL